MFRLRIKNKTLNKVFAFLRRHYLTILVVLVFVVGVIATISIVNKEKNPNNNEEGTISILQPASEIRIAMFTPVSFDPLNSSDEDVVYLNQLIYSFLFKLDNNLNIESNVIENYIPNREAGSVEILLKDGLRFSDGTSMNAYDVEFTINTIKSIGNTSPYFNYVNKVSGVYVTGKDSLTIEFYSPDDASLDNLVFPIVSAGSYMNGSFNVGGGPYKYGDYSEGNKLELLPNEYYLGKIPSSPLIVNMVKNKAILPGLTTMDDVTAYISKESSADDIALDKSLRCRYLPSGELEYLGFNCSNEILSESNMRQAIAYAIDREAIIKDDYGNGAVISDSLYYPGFLDVADEETIKYDPKKSSEILRSLGYIDTNEDKILEDKNGNPLSFKLLVRNDSGNRKDAAETIVKCLQAVGIQVDVIQLSSSDMTTVLKGGSFDMYLGGINLDKQFKLTELFGSANYSRYRNDTVLSLVAQLEQCLSKDEQKGVFTALKPLLNNELPYFSIGYRTYYFISVPSLAMTENPTFFDPYRDIENWVWQKKVTAE